MESLSKIQEKSYDLLLTDYKMPQMTGITLAQQVRKLSPDTAIVMMTAFGSERLHQVIGSLDLDAFINKPVRIRKLRLLLDSILNQGGDGQDPYRAGEMKVNTAVIDPLKELQVNTNAHAVLMLTTGGFLINVTGTVADLDLDSMSALIAANFVAASELAKLLENTAVFESSINEGSTYSIYSYSINPDILLAIIFGVESKLGVVKHYTNRIKPELITLLAEDDAHNAEMLKNISPDLGKSIGDDINDMFDF
jgi:CheY-like chemotaxis protein